MDRTTKQVSRKQLDPVQTRSRILEAAFDVFAEHGFSGASIGAIAVAAQVPKSLVQYHFGSKDELWNEVVAQKSAPMMAALDRFISGEEVDFARVLETRFRLFQQEPKVGRILAWASLTPTPTPHAIAARREALMNRYHDDSMNPKFLSVMYSLAAMDGWFLFRNLYRRVAGDQILGSEIEEKLLQNLLDTVHQE